jgi:hypothetical protein
MVVLLFLRLVLIVWMLVALVFGMGVLKGLLVWMQRIVF